MKLYRYSGIMFTELMIMEDLNFSQEHNTEFSQKNKIETERIITPANLMTMERFILAGNIAKMLIKEEHPVAPYAVGMAITDMDGKVARFFDKHFPKLRLGTTSIGAIADPVVDTASILVISTAALCSPRVSLMGKIAISAVLGQEGLKSAWGLKSAYHYKELTKSENNIHGEKLVLPVLAKGKEAMASKLVSIVCAVATNDFENPKIRKTLGLFALGASGFGSYTGEMTRRIYVNQYKDIIKKFEEK